MTTTVFLNGRSQAVRLPKDFRFAGSRVSIRRLGTGVLLEPVGASSWPADYFKRIRIRDTAFRRPAQGETPPARRLGSS
jgi:antitoxin VapB